jgi:hypothetical protein
VVDHFRGCPTLAASLSLRLGWEAISPTHQFPHRQSAFAHAATSGESPEVLEPAPEVGSPREQARRLKKRPPVNLLPLRFPSFRPRIAWSWRRDLNPRPSDYKSDALPAELRQPKAFQRTERCADTLLFSAYHGTEVKVSIAAQPEQTRKTLSRLLRFDLIRQPECFRRQAANSRRQPRRP